MQYFQQGNDKGPRMVKNCQKKSRGRVIRGSKTKSREKMKGGRGAAKRSLILRIVSALTTYHALWAYT